MKIAKRMIFTTQAYSRLQSVSVSNAINLGQIFTRQLIKAF